MRIFYHSCTESNFPAFDFRLPPSRLNGRGWRNHFAVFLPELRVRTSRRINGRAGDGIVTHTEGGVFLHRRPYFCPSLMTIFHPWLTHSQPRLGNSFFKTQRRVKMYRIFFLGSADRQGVAEQCIPVLQFNSAN